MTKATRTVGWGKACKRVVIGGLGVALGVSLSVAAVAQDRIRWRMASALPTNVPIVGDGAIYFSEKVEEVSRGRLQIKAFDPGKLVPANQIYDAVRGGSVDAGWSYSCYWMGKNTANALFCSVPFGLGLTYYLSWIYSGGGLELWNEIYAKDNLYVMPCNISPPEASGWYRNEITSLDQLKGMKLRYPGIAGEVFQKLGASVQNIPAGEIYTALERGLIDATEYGTPNIDLSLGFYKVAKNYYFPGWHQPSTIGELFINKTKWDGLQEADRSLIKMACRDNLVRDIALYESSQNEALETIRKNGVTIRTWPSEFLAAFKKANDEVMESMSAANPDFAKVYKSMKAFEDRTAEWRKLTAPLR